MAETLATLIRLGFSRYEARAYLALLRKSPLNGYELAKASGVPRPNIYGILDRLEERGAVLRAESQRGTQFAPVASEELLERLRGEFERAVSDAKSVLAEVGTAPEPEPVFNAQGPEATIALARDLVRESERELLLAVWPQEAALLDPETEKAEARGVRITSLCLSGCPQSCGHCRGEVYRYRVRPKGEARWLVVVPDGAEMLSAELDEHGAFAARTRQKLLVELAAWYIRHTIAVAAVVKDLQGREARVLSPETLAVLRSVGSPEGDHDWLEAVREMVRPERLTARPSKRR